MSQGFKVEVKEGGLEESLRGFLGKILDREEIRAVLTPLRLPYGDVVMPVLVTEKDRLQAAEPLSPAYPLSGARILSRLTRQDGGGKVAAVLRPCEIRAFIELVKLKQASREGLVLIGADCAGAFSNDVYKLAAARRGGEGLAAEFRRAAYAGEENPAGFETAAACSVCGHFTPDGADVRIGLFGAESDGEIWVESGTEAGEAMLADMGLDKGEQPRGRPAAVKERTRVNRERREEMSRSTLEAAGGLDKLASYLASCVNCLNCRVACPVCYCRECVFGTDVFEHEPRQYMNWARRKGAVKMPTDTVFYHLTRMAHMAASCVGCGQCSNACPNDIPVMELFSAVAGGVQESFRYEPGRDLLEPIPLAVFREDEFAEVVGR
jgi:formate dehydrogenase (coenzyme F420) beta subunit